MPPMSLRLALLPLIAALGLPASAVAADSAAPRRLCLDPDGAAEDFWFSQADEEAVTLWFDTVQEAESYQDPEGRSVYWLVRVAETRAAVSYVDGINDLWAVEMDVLRFQSCQIVVTAEH